MDTFEARFEGWQWKDAEHKARGRCMHPRAIGPLPDWPFNPRLAASGAGHGEGS